jgi:hypothetical protein
VAKKIIGHSHVPAITKGVYQVGTVSPTGRLDYNKGPVPWQTPAKSWGGAMARAAGIKRKSMAKEFFGESMCGDCIGTKVTGGHDRRNDNRRVCQLCGTVWPGLEPDNNRRQAIADQKARGANNDNST